MAKFKVCPPELAGEELNLMLEAVPEGVAVVVVEHGETVQTLLVFEDTGVISRWPIAETFAKRKALHIDSRDRIVIQD